MFARLAHDSRSHATSTASESDASADTQRAARMVAAVAASVLCVLAFSAATAVADTLPDTTGAVYELMNADSGLVADNPNWSTTDGTEIVQWTRNGGDNQRWILKPVTLDSGVVHYSIRNAHSRLCLAPAYTTADVINVKQTACGQDRGQHWEFTKTLKGYRIRNRRTSTLLRVHNTNEGAKLKLSSPVLVKTKLPLYTQPHDVWQLTASAAPKV